MPRNEPEYRPRSDASRDRTDPTSSGPEGGVIESPAGDINLVVLHPDDVDRVLDKANELLDKQVQRQNVRRRGATARDEAEMLGMSDGSESELVANGNCKNCLC